MSAKKERTPMQTVSAETKVYHPKFGLIEVSKLAEKMAKPKEGSKKRENVIKAIIAGIVKAQNDNPDAFGVSGTAIKDISKAEAEKQGMKVGVAVKTLVAEGFIGRVKVTGVLPQFYVLPKGLEFAGIEAKVMETPATASAEAEKVAPSAEASASIDA